MKFMTESKCPICGSQAVIEIAFGGIGLYCSEKAEHAGVAMATAVQGIKKTDKELYDMASPQLMQWWSDNIAGKVPVKGEVT